ncbi:MAG TPA: hypothetical protein VFH74_02495 [Gaiellales bacterium]|nr:hypothetical protein [Gaiellales bacterium]
MSTSTTLRLAGLVAAIAVSLSITSSALAKPMGMSTVSGSTTGAVTIALHRSGQLVGPADSPADVGTPVIPLQAVRADNPADVGTPASASPMVRVDNPAEVGTPVAVLLPAPAAPAPANGFSWQDATLGALIGIALAGIAAYGVGSIRGRRGLALRA